MTLFAKGFGKLCVAAVAAATGLGVAGPAQATLELKLGAGATSVNIIDGGVGDSCALANCIVWIGTVGGWTLNVEIGRDKDQTAPLLIDLTSANHAAAGAGTLTLWLSDDGFAPPGGAFAFGVGGTLSAGGSATFKAFEGATKFSETNQIGSTLAFTGPGGFAGNTSGNIATDSPYALTEVVTLNFGRVQGDASFDAGITVPEPATLALIGLALAGLGFSRRRKQ